MCKKLCLFFAALHFVFLTSCTMMDGALIGDDRVVAVDEQLVPAQFRHLTPVATQWVLDDVERTDKIEALSRREKRAIIRKVNPHLDAIDRWVDSFDPAAMPEEASAFFWFRLAVEEMRY